MTEFGFGWLTYSAPIGTATWELNMYSEVLFVNNSHSAWMNVPEAYEQEWRDLMDAFRGDDS